MFSEKRWKISVYFIISINNFAFVFHQLKAGLMNFCKNRGNKKLLVLHRFIENSGHNCFLEP